VILCVEFLLPSQAVGERIDGWDGTDRAHE